MDNKAVKKKIKFEYFEVVAVKRGSDENTNDKRFDLQLWLKVVSGLSAEEKVRDYFDEQVKLDSFSQDKDGIHWFLTFTRLRETNIPRIAFIDDRESEDMKLKDDEYLSEHASAIYDKNTMVMMLQRNRLSLSYLGVQEYINKIWNGEDGFDIQLRPIMRKIVDYNYLSKNSMDYRRLSIRFADICSNSNTDKKLVNLENTVQELGEFEANVMEISISMGRNKGSLNPKRIKEVLKGITDSRSIVEKAEIGIANDEGSEVLDLISERILHDYIEFMINKRASLNSQYAQIKMLEVFNAKKHIVLKDIRKG